MIRTVEALTVQTPGGIGFPHAQQAVRITRTRTVAGKRTRETVYLVVSLPAAHANPLTCRNGHAWNGISRPTSPEPPAAPNRRPHKLITTLTSSYPTTQ
ncbi:hypothetical protein ACWD8I_05440 [Micromonospora arida]|uniref:Uncharacterized protein n=1 Tax=Micromonospora zamorensis TaxID=709883 RepID=A0ABZ1PHY0_9ACTN